MTSPTRAADIEGLERALADLQTWRDQRRSSTKSNNSGAGVRLLAIYIAPTPFFSHPFVTLRTARSHHGPRSLPGACCLVSTNPNTR